MRSPFKMIEDWLSPPRVTGIPTSPLYAPMPDVPPARTAVGEVVVILGHSYQHHLNQRASVEAVIAARQEDLRQINTILDSLEAALVVAADDPALMEDEIGLAAIAVDGAMSRVVEDMLRDPAPVEASSQTEFDWENPTVKEMLETMRTPRKVSAAIEIPPGYSPPPSPNYAAERAAAHEEHSRWGEK